MTEPTSNLDALLHSVESLSLADVQESIAQLEKRLGLLRAIEKSMLPADAAARRIVRKPRSDPPDDHDDESDQPVKPAKPVDGRSAMGMTSSQRESNKRRLVEALRTNGQQPYSRLMTLAGLSPAQLSTAAEDAGVIKRNGLYCLPESYS